MAQSPLEDATGPLGVSIKLAGQQLEDDVQVISVRVFNALNRIPEAVFAVQSTTAQIDDFSELDGNEFALGTEVEIAGFYGADEEQRIFTGIITACRLRAEQNAGVRMEVTCRDKAIKMTEVRSSQIHEKVKDSDVMSKIAQDAALTADIAATSSTAPLVLRVASSDWDYLRLLADRNGHVIAVDAGKITSGPIDMTQEPVLALTFGMDIIDIDITLDAQRMIGSASTVAWNAQTQKTLVGKDQTLTNLTFGSTTMSKIADVTSKRDAVATTARDREQADLTTFSKARMARAALATVRGSVRFQGSGKVWPGDTIEFAGTGQRFGGKGYVTAVEHELKTDAGWTTTARLGLPQDWTTDAAGIAAPPAGALNAPIRGMQIGKVVKNFGDPDGQQRIQIELPLIADPPAKVWARHATPYASSDVGFEFLPEVGDEVVVAFLDADPEAPVIVGALHNAKAKRPVEAAQDNNLKTIVTREKLKVTFDDKDKKIVVETPLGRVLTMNDTDKLVSLVDELGNSIEMNASGITLKSDKDITVKATGNVSITASMDAKLSGMNIACEADVQFTGKGGSMAEFSSGGITTVKGSLVNIN